MRLTTDNPHSCTEMMLNYAYAKNGRVCLRYGEGQNDIDLCEYISEVADKKRCKPSTEDVINGACMECDCELGILYSVATQAAELRERLKEYEDLGFTPQELAVRLRKARNCGKWIICSDGYYPYCSECNHRPKNGTMTNYCPECGARMDGEK